MQFLARVGKSDFFHPGSIRKVSADRMADSADYDQTAPCRSSLIRIYTVCLSIFVPKLKAYIAIFMSTRLSREKIIDSNMIILILCQFL